MITLSRGSPQLGWGRVSTDKRFEKVQQKKLEDDQVYKTVLPFVYSHRAAAHQFHNEWLSNLLEAAGSPNYWKFTGNPTCYRRWQLLLHIHNEPQSCFKFSQHSLSSLHPTVSPSVLRFKCWPNRMNDDDVQWRDAADASCTTREALEARECFCASLILAVAQSILFTGTADCVRIQGYPSNIIWHEWSSRKFLRFSSCGSRLESCLPWHAQSRR